MSLCALGLREAAADIREGRITSVGLVTDCLARVDEVDADVQAWAFLDRGHALAQAEALDLHRREGKALGALHGVPIGIKDIFDTGDMPTELGSPLWAGRMPRRDAAAVSRLRSAGAVMGTGIGTMASIRAVGGKWKPCGATPTTCRSRDPSLTPLPTIPGSEPKRLCQSS